MPFQDAANPMTRKRVCPSPGLRYLDVGAREAGRCKRGRPSMTLRFTGRVSLPGLRANLSKSSIGHRRA
jgi:hypothetical protein